MSRPAALRAVIGHGNRARQCELDFLDNGFRCALQPAVLSRRLPKRVARCPTCGTTPLSASDILQAVAAL
jgi:hypothetical protein